MATGSISRESQRQGAYMLHSNDDVIYHVECIDKIYKEAGMPARADPEEIRTGERGQMLGNSEKSNG